MSVRVDASASPATTSARESSLVTPQQYAHATRAYIHEILVHMSHNNNRACALNTARGHVMTWLRDRRCPHRAPSRAAAAPPVAAATAGGGGGGGTNRSRAVATTPGGSGPPTAPCISSTPCISDTRVTSAAAVGRRAGCGRMRMNRMKRAQRRDARLRGGSLGPALRCPGADVRPLPCPPHGDPPPGIHRCTSLHVAPRNLQPRNRSSQLEARRTQQQHAEREHVDRDAVLSQQHLRRGVDHVAGAYRVRARARGIQELRKRITHANPP